MQNLVLPKAGPANWLSFLGVGFGAVLIGMGFTKSWGMMALCRALLGVLEAGFLPGCTYLITCWYTRFEVGRRLSGFWILSVITGGFSAIFAYVLTLLKGRGGLNGWSCWCPSPTRCSEGNADRVNQGSSSSRVPSLSSSAPSAGSSSSTSPRKLESS